MGDQTSNSIFKKIIKDFNRFVSSTERIVRLIVRANCTFDGADLNFQLLFWLASEEDGGKVPDGILRVCDGLAPLLLPLAFDYHVRIGFYNLDKRLLLLALELNILPQR